jgi:hypothetical protein
MVVDTTSRKIVCTAFGKGRKHDFHLFKDSMKKDSKCFVDSGYQGIQQLHANSEHPKKRSKKQPLTKEDKQRNRQMSSIRITVENIIGEVKILRTSYAVQVSNSSFFLNQRKRAFHPLQPAQFADCQRLTPEPFCRNLVSNSAPKHC